MRSFRGSVYLRQFSCPSDATLTSHPCSQRPPLSQVVSVRAERCRGCALQSRGILPRPTQATWKCGVVPSNSSLYRYPRTMASGWTGSSLQRWAGLHGAGVSGARVCSKNCLSSKGFHDSFQEICLFVCWISGSAPTTPECFPFPVLCFGCP